MVADAGGVAGGPPDRAELGEATLAFVVVDDECRCLDASEEACRLLGRLRVEALGVALDELLAEDARERFAHFWRAFREGGGHAGPFRVDGPTPLEIDVNVTAEVLPSRHLVLLSPVAAAHGAEASDGDDGRASASPRWPRRAQPAPTSRERQILRLLAAGATDGEIARRLSLSRATVRTHVRNVKAKLGASTRAQAVAIAIERQMIEAR